IAGLMSSQHTAEITKSLNRMTELARSMGVIEGVDPFITLSFMALPVIPSLKITDMGLFDVDKFEFVK
ncbi:MAG: adenine deaminase, partial [Phascolarctobacterium sp.]|nr:adenine deaminase [Candidatus Phascolarctobacterium equi]